MSLVARAFEEPWCRRCEDTGWAYRARATGLVCQELPVGSHAEVAAFRCPCVDGNPRIQAKRAREAVVRETWTR